MCVLTFNDSLDVRSAPYFSYLFTIQPIYTIFSFLSLCKKIKEAQAINTETAVSFL